MASKLVTSVLIVSLLQNVFDLSYATSAEITTESWKIFDHIDEPVNLMILEEYAVFRPIINSLRKSTKQILSHDQLQDASSTAFNSTEALERWKNALDNILNATSIAAGGTCPTGESFQRASYANVTTAIQSIERAIASAKAGKYPKYKANFEIDKNETQRALLSIGKNIVYLIESCLQIDNRNDGRKVLETVKNGIQTSFIALVNFLYNVIIILGTVVSDNTSYDIDHALTAIDSNLVNALLAIAGFAAYLSGILESCSLDRELGGTDILNTLYIVRYYEKVSIYNANFTTDVLASADVNRLEKRTNVIETDRLNYYPTTLANQSAAAVGIAGIIAGILDGIEKAQPISAVKVIPVKLLLPTLGNVIAAGWFKSIAIADNNGLLCATAPTTIALIDTAQVSLVATAVIILFVSLNNSPTTTLKELAPGIECSAMPAFNFGTKGNHLIYEGSKLLSYKVCKNQGATQADFGEIRNVLYHGQLNFIKASKLIHRANLIQVLDNHGYTVKRGKSCSLDVASLLKKLGISVSTIADDLQLKVDQNLLQLSSLENVKHKLTNIPIIGDLIPLKL